MNASKLTPSPPGDAMTSHRRPLPTWASRELQRVRPVTPERSVSDVFTGPPMSRRQRRMQAHYERAARKKDKSPGE